MSDEGLEKAIAARNERLAKEDEPYGYLDSEKIDKALGGPGALDFTWVDLFSVWLRLRVVLSSLLMSSAALLWCAYGHPVHSFWNVFLIETASGVAFFAVAPTAIHLAQRHRKTVRSIGVIASIAGVVVAHEVDRLLPWSEHVREFAQAALLDYSAAIALLTVLELIIRPQLDGLEEKRHRLRAHMEDVARAQEEWQQQQRGGGSDSNRLG